MFARSPAVWILALLLSLAVVVAALSWGAPISPRDLWGDDPERVTVAQRIFFELRPPRLIAALLVGASLALGGAGAQSLFRNPLAEPYLLGISSGGALGAALSLALRLPSVGVFDAGAVLALFGALGSALAVYALGSKRAGDGFSGGDDRARLLLVGVALSAFSSALLALVVALSGRLDLAQQIAFWLLGGLGRADWPSNGVLLLFFALGAVLLFSAARDLNALRLGDEEAAALGVEMKALRGRILLAVSLLSAASVAVAGLIGFVGLLAPHIVRLLGARDARFLLPASAWAGAILLTVCDTLARGLFTPIEVPIGILTALLGVPLFLSLARKM